ncbi:nuclear transport factor 2 family protein [Acidisoma sp. L85]|uniref:nuclear transport factor 2 family protein n=1 Tax=Acidisoma sp. L85 TaxID=1641850 RepID=UPI00131C4C65|nr:nuclear transport factor 2 family protein [Acidisoma sp. L85]
MGEALQVVREFYSLPAVGDEPQAIKLLDPEIEWTEAERTPYFNGTLRGVTALVTAVATRLFEPMQRDFKEFRTVPGEFITEGDRVVAFGNYFGLTKRFDRTMSAPFVHCWTVSDGRLRQLIHIRAPRLGMRLWRHTIMFDSPGRKAVSADFHENGR